MQSKWHNISIKTESFKELQQIQKQIPIRVSIPQTIEWLIDVGQKEINRELQYDNTRRISKP
jgi:phosphoenolpyruvate synthase/pyruvate phosphate dikinase|tara:strand:- start:41 stop:226 length:186 start_codon:yes stop_codon:yes gene_type:complete